MTSIFSKLDLGHDRAENQRVLAVLTLLRRQRRGASVVPAAVEST